MVSQWPDRCPSRRVSVQGHGGGCYLRRDPPSMGKHTLPLWHRQCQPTFLAPPYFSDAPSPAPDQPDPTRRCRRLSPGRENAACRRRKRTHRTSVASSDVASSHPTIPWQFRASFDPSHRPSQANTGAALSPKTGRDRSPPPHRASAGHQDLGRLPRPPSVSLGWLLIRERRSKQPLKYVPVLRQYFIHQIAVGFSVMVPL